MNLVTQQHLYYKHNGKTSISDYDPDFNPGFQQGSLIEKEINEKLTKELAELQTLLYVSHSHSVLVILQGFDTSGKDGTIRSVFSSINPMGVDIAGFGAPMKVELGHDFLWRVHSKVPEKGKITLFNRSYYEDVLIAAVEKLAPKESIENRYKHINNFEHLLIDQSNTIIIKIFLHISHSEQLKRLILRRNTKMWKWDPSDELAHEKFKEYVTVYDEAFKRCSEHAQWYIVPANKKWYRDIAVKQILVNVLSKYSNLWKKEMHQITSDKREYYNKHFSNDNHIQSKL